MSLGHVTRILLVVVILALAGWASVVSIFGQPLDTVSAHIRDYSAAAPILPFALGVLVGHWLWPQGPPVKRNRDGTRAE
jgi:peptidoglycan/LPS O-acetylase OafA/YrhL